MIAVVGGTYQEFCQFPQWRQTYGSGGRAAAAIASLGGEAQLHTFGDSSTLAMRQALASVYGFELKHVEAAPDIAFDYFHAMRPVHVTPSYDPLFDSARRLLVTADRVLRYGMLEGEAVVAAQRAVYDPQSPTAPLAFEANGSKAKELAVVCNLQEAQRLTGRETADECAQVLIGQGAAVVVVKSGIQGAFVRWPGGATWIPSYRCERVFPIGSGDVFSAVFAHSWLDKEMRPDDAAALASKATALYCNSQTLPTANTLGSGAANLKAFQAQRPISNAPRIYLAGPFFSMHELWLVEQVRAELEGMGLRVFSPFHEVGTGMDAVQTASQDLQGLDAADMVFALLDGLDAGTIFEVGYAQRSRKPIVALVHKVDPGDLTMLVGTGTSVESDLSTAIYKAAWTAWSLR